MKKSILTSIICIIALLICFSCGDDKQPTEPTDNGLTEQEKQAIIETHDSISVTADSVLLTDDPIEGFKELLPSYQSYANVESTWVTNNALYVRYEKGIVVCWIKTPNVIIPSGVDSVGGGSMPKPTGIKGFQELIGNNKVCLINQQYYDETPAKGHDITRAEYCREIIDNLSNLFRDRGYEVIVTNGEDANIDFFDSELKNFGVIFYISHGNYGDDTWLATGEEGSLKDLLLDHPWDAVNSRIMSATVDETRNGKKQAISYYCISQRFIDSKYSEGDFPHSLVYLTACQSFKSTGLAKIFNNKGVAVTIGWHETNGLGQWTGELLFESLLLDCPNLETAFNSLSDEDKEGANLTYYPSSGGSVQLCEVPAVVHFADPNLEAVIREKINKPSGDIYPSDVAGIETLYASYRQITSLDGIESLVNLTMLALEHNQISDLVPLSGLTSLTELDLDENQISDLGPLSGLTSLTELCLHVNQISDLAPLSGLTNLTSLQLWCNQISDLSPLSGLTNLTKLYLRDNQISDLGPLSGLTSLTSLSLDGNQISDLSPLSGLTSLTELWLTSNQISNLAPLSGLTSLTYLRLRFNQISDLYQLSGLTSLTDLHLGDNQITDLTPLSGLTNLCELCLYGNQITDLAPLSGLTNLRRLWLNRNQISDLSPLSGLTSLTGLSLYDNQISNLYPLVENEGLGAGDEVDVRNNPLSDTSISDYIPALQARGVDVRY